MLLKSQHNTGAGGKFSFRAHANVVTTTPAADPTLLHHCHHFSHCLSIIRACAALSLPCQQAGAPLPTLINGFCTNAPGSTDKWGWGDAGHQGGPVTPTLPDRAAASRGREMEQIGACGYVVRVQ